MYKEPYNCRINLQAKQNIEKTSQQIKDEMEKGEQADINKIMRLYEHQMMQGSMLTQFDGVYGKYQNPW